MKRTRTAFLLSALLLASAPASAQIVQSVQVGGGVHFPRGLDARVDDDVLVRNHFGEALPGLPTLTDALAFEIGDFRAPNLLGEWNVAFGHHVELGVGVGVYRRTVPTVYLDLIDEDGTEIEQELKLRVIPLTAVVRFLPFGQPGDVQPYVGAGLAALNFRYSETGEFVDGETLEIFEDAYTVSGTAPGAVLLGGLRLPLGGDIYAFGIEGRYLVGQGDTLGTENGFLADTIDLSSTELTFTFMVRF